MYDLIVLGGGVAGFFGAINYAKKNPKKKVVILERSSQCLSKLRITGGGKGNIAHASYTPKALANNYPRGNKELTQLFKIFQTKDIIAWMHENGIKTEESVEGRIYPVGQNSATVIELLLAQAKKYKIDIKTNCVVTDFLRRKGNWNAIVEEDSFIADKILVTTGGNKLIWQICEKLGHQVTYSVPTLFTFEIPNSLVTKTDEIHLPNVKLEIVDSKFSINGPLTVNSTGLAGEAILRLSSMAAKELYELDYTFILSVNWLNKSIEEVVIALHNFRVDKAERKVIGINPFDLPKKDLATNV